MKIERIVLLFTIVSMISMLSACQTTGVIERIPVTSLGSILDKMDESVLGIES